ncbi:shikimate kinase [Oenococcus sp. UCMA 14587]|nr:shikimate kinase [Oenococcus sp. UCMA 14587]
MKVILIGFMASGKTTVGRILAENLQTVHFDLDQLLVLKTGQTVPELFLKRGESGFRKLEHELLAEVLSRDGVLSTGGGTLLRPDNFQLLSQLKAPKIFLKVAISTVLLRLTNDQQTTRSMIQKVGLRGLEKLERVREKQYRQLSDYEIVTDHLSAQQVAELICQKFQLSRQLDNR